MSFNNFILSKKKNYTFTQIFILFILLIDDKRSKENSSIYEWKVKSDKLGRRRKSLYTPFYRQSYLEVSLKYFQIFHKIETFWKFQESCFN